jgi:hypothetical protein
MNDYGRPRSFIHKLRRKLRSKCVQCGHDMIDWRGVDSCKMGCDFHNHPDTNKFIRTILIEK